ncbi:hypothetical protein QA635_15130 [Bradyrhizobium brasilense]|uniref:hypothetical protein n=1 Tax=Bradyrhizobium brasilense TaxID=1419277 RepID=UPI0024B07BCD|nr:hypothetical protein [Bradyrhizobium australafricanum]WFU35661.1 hypothetical protein QA635_15130 [Bradyrhizobium australafricanum]
MPLLATGEYRPDVSDYEGQATRNILNVIPRGDGYGPFPSLSAYAAPLPAACRGAFYALKSDGTVVTFAGTSNKLYKLNNTDFTWTDVSSGGGTYSALSANAQWQFAQTGNFVFATQANTTLQMFDLSSASTFGNALGSPPQAAYIGVVGRFLVLSGLLSNPYRIQWSGLNNFNAADSWISGIKSSDFQDFPDGGIVRGVAGGEAGIIFQDQAIRRMSYVPGSPIVFQIDRITQDKGLYAPYSIIRAGERIFFYAGQGFHKIEPGGVPEQIGREKVDRTFLADLDKGNLQLFMGAADPRSTRVYWAYKSVSGAVGNTYDKLLGYDFLLDRFFPVSMTGEYLLGVSQTGLTLENLDTISSSIDAMTLSLDAYATAVQPEIAQFNNSHVLGFFRGLNLEATLESAEQGSDENRITIRGFRPITDAPTLYGSVSTRDTPSASAVPGTEVLVNARTGRCDMMQDTRYSRFKVRIPAATQWTFCAGVVPDVIASGAL